ncbi:MAG: 2-oxoacid:acceptor oxidoreductase family protein [Oscillospiraceae bacterium]
MSVTKMFFAGSGGQGILLMGQMITYSAMNENKEVTFLPSYGPEMRGGTANCTVVVSDDKPVSCPLIYEADAMVVMNLPSLIKFEKMVKPGGKLFVNTSLIERKPIRTDIEIINVPANDIAIELGNARAANIVMLGAFRRATEVVSKEAIDHMIEKTFSGKKAALLDLNKKAVEAFKG